jgi:PucR C-terminal helix-turn-helix domain
MAMKEDAFGGDTRAMPSVEIHAGAAAIVARIPREEAVRLMVTTLQSQVLAFEHLAEDSHADIRAGLERTLRRWSRFVAAGVMPGEGDFAPLREWTRMRATEGFRLEDLLRSFGLLHRLGWQLLRAHANLDEAPALVDLAGLLAQYMEQVSVVVTETYLAERDLLVSEDERRTRSLLDRLSVDAPLDAVERETAKRLGVPLGRLFSPFAASIPGNRPHRHAALAGRLRRTGFELTVTQSDCVVGLAWTELGLGDLGEGPGVLLAIGEPTPRRELGPARQQLAAFMAYARRVGLAGCVRVEDYLLEIMLEGSPRLARRLRERVLGPLGRDAHGDLAHTLRTLLSLRMDRSATSAALHIHRNTLTHRIARIEELTGLQIGDPRDLACLYAAVRAAGSDEEADA